MRREQKKPLNDASIGILLALHQLTGQGTLVFPAIGSRMKPISENTMNQALRRMGL